jgi:hypothetical protein
LAVRSQEIEERGEEEAGGLLFRRKFQKLCIEDYYVMFTCDVLV